MRGKNKVRGFTLLELMIVVIVVAILATLAIYNYARYGYRARRADGQNMIQKIAAAEERYYTNFNNYTTSITGAAPGGLAFPSTNSEKGYYSVSAAVGTGNQTYTLTATPAGPQTNDKCGQLILDNTGAKSASPGDTSNGSCW
jgi:type IV pilus assembly protein PilE